MASAEKGRGERANQATLQTHARTNSIYSERHSLIEIRFSLPHRPRLGRRRSRHTALMFCRQKYDHAAWRGGKRRAVLFTQR